MQTRKAVISRKNNEGIIEQTVIEAPARLDYLLDKDTIRFTKEKTTMTLEPAKGWHEGSEVFIYDVKRGTAKATLLVYEDDQLVEEKDLFELADEMEADRKAVAKYLGKEDLNVNPAVFFLDPDEPQDDGLTTPSFRWPRGFKVKAPVMACTPEMFKFKKER